MLHHTPSRQQPRVPIDVEVAALDGEQQSAARARDLSLGGLYVDAPAGSVLEQLSQVSLTFTLPGQDEAIWALCEVVRDDRRRQVDGHALRFTRMAEPDRQRLRAYMGDYYAPFARPRSVDAASAGHKRKQKDLFRFRCVGDLLR